jgi:hypothetical protein
MNLILLDKPPRSFEHQQLGPLRIQHKRIIQRGSVPQFKHQRVQGDGLHFQLIDIMNSDQISRWSPNSKIDDEAPWLLAMWARVSAWKAINLHKVVQ